MSRIDLNIVATANFSSVESQLARLKAQISSINAMKMVSPIGPGVQSQLDSYLKTFRETIDASGMYERHVVDMANETEKFGKSLEKGTLRLGQLYKTALEYRRSEMGQIRQLAREQVRMENAIAVARGGNTADVFVPRGLDEGIEKTRILSKEYTILRQVISNGSTELINWGKNTQWAGRQLTVGLTVPITMFGAAAAKAFMDADKQLTRLTKVYGDAAKGMVSSSELSAIRQEALGLAKDIASSMGVSVTETLGVAADIAATGKEGNDLLAATREAMRLSVLGEVDRQEAMRATLAIQTVFKQSTEGLTDSINFLNAVENQTSTSLNDLVVGIVKAGPVVQGLGGSIEDLSLMMVAMREGGVPAAEAANAIKSSLGALINPTKQTTEVLNGFGVNLKEIVDSNAGDVIGTLENLQTALSGLDQLSRQRAIEQIFGKFQFSRINALLNNINRAGSQTEQVMKLAGLSTAQLAQTADKELSAVTESVTGRFQRAVESLKANLIPIGETFTEVGTLLLNVGTKILEVFNSLPDPIKNFFKMLTMGTAVIGPLIMITGVLGNFFGYLVKGISTLMLFKRAGREAFSMLGPESAAVKVATDQLTESLFNQTTAVETMESAVAKLILKLEELQQAMTQTSTADVVPSADVLSRAEAAAMGGGSPYFSPTSPYLKRSTGGGLKRPDITYSHLTPESYIKGLLGESAGSVMGMGSFVPGPRAAEINRLLQNFLPDVTSIRESTVTDQQRKEMLMSYGVSQNLAPDKLKDLQKIISEMSSAELAQMLPSWEKISSQQSHYVGMVMSIQQGLSKNFDQTKIALETYADDIITHGPEIAAEKLINTLNGLGIDVQKNIDATALELEKIRQEVETLPEIERPRALVEKVTKRVTQAMELPATEAIVASGAKGFTKDARKGLIETLMYAAQQTTDRMFKAGLISEELANAMQESINAQSSHQKSLSLLKDAENKLKTTSEALANKRKEIESKVGSPNYTLQKGPDGWTYGPGSPLPSGTKVEDPELIKLLDQQTRLVDKAKAASEELDAARENLTQAEISLAHAEEKLEKETIAEAKRMSGDASSKEVEQAEQELANAIEKEAAERKKRAALTAQRDKAQADMNAALLRGGGTSSPEYKAALEMHQKAQAELLKSDIDLAQSQQELVNATEKLTLAKKKDAAATEKDTAETLQAANSENIQEQANIKNANATNVDTAETAASSGGGNLLTKPGGKLSLAGGMIGSALSMATMFIPTGENKALDAATNILGGAGTGASLGGMAGPWGALAGGLIGAAIPALTEYTNMQNETNAALSKYSESLNGSSVLLDQFAKETGKLKPTEQLNAAIGKISSPEKTIAAGAAVLETEAGKQLLDIAKQFSGTQLVDALRAQLTQLTLLEIFTPEEAKAVAETLAVELKQPMLGQALVDGINSVLDGEGKLISDKVAELFTKTIPKFDFSNMPVPDITQMQGADVILNIADLEKWASENIGGIVSNLDKLREAQALVTKEFMDGNITYKEYSNQMSQIREQNKLAAETLYKLKDAGVKVSDMMLAVAEAGGLTDQFKAAENAAKDLMNTLVDAGGMPILGTEQTSKFYTDIQISAAYGDITESDVRSILQLAQDPTEKINLNAIFNIEGAQQNATEIIKLLNSGLSTDFILKITTNANEVGASLDSLYASLVAISALPTEIQKKVITDITNSPELLGVFIQNYEYAMGLPDSKKQLQAEISGNDQLEYFKDNWQSFIQLPAQERKTAVFQYMITGSYDFAQPAISAPTAVTELAGPNISELMKGFSDSGGGGSAADSVSSALDKKIKQQDQIIRQIQKEREERQKLLDLEKQALDFAMREQDLKNQIARARAEGKTAEAAMLQAQLDNERATNKQQEQERIRQENEDKRIAAAERAKKRLEKQKEKASGGGSSGGGGGLSDADTQRIQRSVQFLNDELTSALIKSTPEILDKIAQKGAGVFWKSEPIKRYTAAAKELGIPLKLIREQLQGVYNELINKGFTDQGVRQFENIKQSLIDVGIAGETLNNVLPNVFGILSDTSLTKQQVISKITKEFIRAGDSASAAADRAKEFFKVSGQRRTFKSIEDFNKQLSGIKDQLPDPSEFEKIANLYAEGMKRGLTNKEILDNISNSIFKSTFEDGIKRGLSPDAAAVQAQGAANSIKDTLTSNFDQFSITIGSEFDASGLPSFMRGAFEAAQRGPVGTPTWSTTVDVKSTVQLAQGASKDNPLYVNVVNPPPTSGGNGGSSSGGGPKVGDISADGRLIWNGRNWVPITAASGGLITGPGTGTSDSIPAMLSNGEYVIRAASVKKYGTDLMNSINVGKFARGGYVSADRAETAAQGNVYGGIPKPQYSGGTPTYSGGYTSASTQGTYKPKKKWQIGGGDFGRAGIDYPINNTYNPDDPTGLKGLVNTIRVGLATVLDSFAAPFRVPLGAFGVSTSSNTPLGNFIGGSDYINADMLSRGLSAMSIIPVGGIGKSSTTGTRNISRQMFEKDRLDLELLTGTNPAGLSSRQTQELLYTTRTDQLISKNPSLRPGSPEFLREFIKEYYPFAKESDVITLYKGIETGKKLDNLRNWTGNPNSTGAFFSANPVVAESFASLFGGTGKLASMDVPVRDFLNGSEYIRGFPFHQGAPGKTWTDEMEAIIDYLNVPDYVRSTLSIKDVTGYRNVKTTNAIYDLLNEFFGVRKYADGGMIFGPGGPKSDMIPAMLSNGEYVVNAGVVNKYGKGFMDMLNKGMLPKMAMGGYSKYPSIVAGMKNGGYISPTTSSNELEKYSGSEYNINVTVASTNASPDEIASAVLQTLQRREKMNRAGIRI